jgi:hypothetical protein
MNVRRFLLSGSNGKNGAMGSFSDHKSSSAGSIPVSPNRHGSTREQIIPPEPSRTCKYKVDAHDRRGVKSIDRWEQKPSPVWGSIYDQRKIPLHHF